MKAKTKKENGIKVSDIAKSLKSTKPMLFEFGWDDRRKKDEIRSAKSELTQAEAIKVLLKNNDLGAEIHIARMTMGTCNNKLLLPVIEFQIKEIKKFLKGQPNMWE